MTGQNDYYQKTHSYTPGGNVNWCSHCGKQYGEFSEKLKREPPYDLAIILLGIYLKTNKQTKTPLICEDTCTPMFTAALLTIAKIQK